MVSKKLAKRMDDQFGSLTNTKDIITEDEMEQLLYPDLVPFLKSNMTEYFGKKTW